MSFKILSCILKRDIGGCYQKKSNMIFEGLISQTVQRRKPQKLERIMLFGQRGESNSY